MTFLMTSLMTSLMASLMASLIRWFTFRSRSRRPPRPRT